MQNWLQFSISGFFLHKRDSLGGANELFKDNKIEWGSKILWKLLLWKMPAFLKCNKTDIVNKDKFNWKEEAIKHKQKVESYKGKQNYFLIVPRK